MRSALSVKRELFRGDTSGLAPATAGRSNLAHSRIVAALQSPAVCLRKISTVRDVSAS
jgi:hypothetical protein